MSDAGPNPGGQPYPAASSAAILLVVLMVANTLSYVDRQIISLVIDPIRHDLKMTDLQVGLLMGPTFSLFYAFMGLPLGRLVDRRKRLWVAAIAITAWSLMTVLAGLSTTIGQLFLTRIGVAVGEAVLMPAASSLLADCYPPHKRARALGMFAIATYLGFGLAHVFGGAILALATALKQAGMLVGPLAGLAPWQLCLVIVGLPGLPVAAVLAFALKEPVRRETLAPGARPGERIRATWLNLLRARGPAYSSHFIGFGSTVIVTVALASWSPAILSREYGVSLVNAGVWLGLLNMSAGALTILSVTTIADRLNQRDSRNAKFRLGTYCGMFALMCAGLCLLPLPMYGYLFVFTGMICGISGAAGLSSATLMEITPNEFRGQAVATYQTIAAIAGGLGIPLAVVANNAIFAGGSIRLGVAVVCTGAMLASVSAFLMGRHAFGRAVEQAAADRAMQPHG